MQERTYVAIDLKSFYASVECRERGLDPLDTNLVVADESRTDKTICLAVTPPLKSLGIPGRGRLFEVKQKVAEINARRRYDAPGRKLEGRSCSLAQLQADPTKELDFIIAPPRMAHYMDYSTMVYEAYTRFISPQDIVVYSIDEVFMDVTHYLPTYGLTARELTAKMIAEVYETTGVTATAGIGSNLFLAKVAMDIVAKHLPADKNGVRIAELDEMSFRRRLWDHRPLTDFWRIGRGTAARLERVGIQTMGEIARCSLVDEALLYKLFGKNAELVIDHAWGWEPCTIPDIKAYRPSTNCLSSGQVLHQPYTAEKAGLVLREMAEGLALDLTEKGLVTDQLVVTVGYDTQNLMDEKRRAQYRGPVVTDFYGRAVPKQAHGTHNLGGFTASIRRLTEGAMEVFTRCVDQSLLIRRLNITVNHVLPNRDPRAQKPPDQLSLFRDYEAEEREEQQEQRDMRRQQAMLEIKRRFGANAILKGRDFEEGATTRDRNAQIGGHKA